MSSQAWGGIVAIALGTLVLGLAVVIWKYITQYNRWVRVKLGRRQPQPASQEVTTRWIMTAFAIFWGIGVIVLGIMHL